jgi:multidrug resistance efflux pump
MPNNKQENEELEKEKAEGISNSEDSDSNQTEKKAINKAVWTTRIVMLIAAIFFVWYIFSDRLTPYTSQAQVTEIILPVVPMVSGYLIETNVHLHSHVKAGELLFIIDTSQYALAVRKAQANLEKVIQDLGAQGADVEVAASSVGVSKAQLDRAQRNYDRAQRVIKKNPGALSQADIDRVETSLDQAKEKLSSTEANLVKAKRRLGISGDKNPQLRLAINDLHNAQLQLSWTEVYAPSDGYIESYNMDLGYFCQAGKPMVTLLTKEDIWIQANFKENNISNMKIGDRVDFILDIAPGRIFSGKVRSISFGVKSDNTSKAGGLADPSVSSSWLQDPQRFPVIISINDSLAIEISRSGGQADVVVYTGEHSFLNSMANFRIWINSKLSYVR